MRTLVSDVPTGWLAVLFVGGAMAVAAGTFWLARRTDFRSPSTGADTYVSAFGTRASTLFGILLVFAIVSEFGSFQSADKTVRSEATSLAELVRNTQSLPSGPRGRIRTAALPSPRTATRSCSTSGP